MSASVNCPRCNGRRTEPWTWDVPLPPTVVYAAPPLCRLCRGHGWASWTREPQGMATPILVVREEPA